MSGFFFTNTIQNLPGKETDMEQKVVDISCIVMIQWSVSSAVTDGSDRWFFYSGSRPVSVLNAPGLFTHLVYIYE